jgi:arginine-tRNA-protein transferase
VEPEAAHRLRTERLGELLAGRRRVLGDLYGCPYLPGREARQSFVLPQPLEGGVYHALMDWNFRRVGPLFYEPACPACNECRMIRIPVREFRANRAQRRCRLRNRDLGVTVGRPAPSDEKHALYRRYLAARHDGQMDGSASEFETFLYTSPVDTLEYEYRSGEKLVAVGIVDREPLALSAVYCYFDPDEERRSPGVFNVLTLLAQGLREGRPYLYLGFLVRESRAMAYKTGFEPCEVRQPDGRWQRE